MGSCFSICMGSSPPSRLSASSRLLPPPLHTHISHTINYLFQPSSFTYHLSHTIFHTISHTSLSITIFHIPSFTTIFHTPSFNHHLCQPPSFIPSSSELFHFRGIQVDSNHSDSKPRATMRSKWRWYFASQSKEGPK